MSYNNCRKCAKCGKSRAQDMTVTYHRFPKPGKANITKAHAWAKYCWPNEDWTSLKSLYSLYISNKVLCGRHFNSSQFYDNQRQKLSRFAVPDLFELGESFSDQGNLISQTMEKTAVENTFRPPLQEIHNIEVGATSTCTPTKISVGGPSTSKAAHIEQTATATTKETHDNLLVEPHPASNKSSRIFKIMNISRINDMSPREVRLYKEYKKSVKEIMRLRKKLKKKRVSNILETLYEDGNVQKLCNSKISNSFALLLQTQLTNWPRKPKGRRYTLKQKIMALIIFKKSPACYRLLRRMFALPCQSSLNKLLNKIPLKPGINGHIFKSLKEMSQNQLDEDNLCILSFDEMAIRKHLSYNRRLDEIQGFHDHAHHGRSKNVATKALVLMLSGIRKKWKQPIAYYLSHKLTADRLSVIIKEILKECFDAKMNVVATVCDLSTINLKSLRTLGATTRDPFFSIHGHEIVTILDPPHLLKCTKNLFMKYNVECTTDIQCNDNPVKGTAKWSDIELFYELDKNNSIFVFAPAITNSHLHPNIKQKMRVKLAAQVLSHHVAAGILTKISSNELPIEAHATATFVKKFDELFDSLNADSANLRNGKKNSTNLTARSPHLELFGDMKKFICSMKYLGSQSSPPSQEGWIQTMNAVERLWKNLQAMKITSLSTRRLNQDCLENFFGCVRYSCGSNNNPTVEQFVAGVKTAIISNLRHSGQKMNCENDSAVLCNNLTSFLTLDLDLQKSYSSEVDVDNEESLLTESSEAVENAIPESQACAYVCGFIFKKLRHSSCVDCRKAFLSNNYEALHIFTTLSEYDTNANSLNYVNKSTIQCVEHMAQIINNYLIESAWEPNVKKKILELLKNVDFQFLNVCQNHLQQNIKHIQISTFFICIKRYTIVKNREMEEEEKRKTAERKIRILRNN